MKDALEGELFSLLLIDEAVRGIGEVDGTVALTTISFGLFNRFPLNRSARVVNVPSASVRETRRSCSQARIRDCLSIARPLERPLGLRKIIASFSPGVHLYMVLAGMSEKMRYPSGSQRGPSVNSKPPRIFLASTSGMMDLSLTVFSCMTTFDTCSCFILLYCFKACALGM